MKSLQQLLKTSHNLHELTEFVQVVGAQSMLAFRRALLAVSCSVLLADQSAVAFLRSPALTGGRPAVGMTCAGPARQAVRSALLAMRGAEGETGDGTLRSAERKPFGVGGGELRILRDVSFRLGMPAREVSADLSPSLPLSTYTSVCVCVFVRACVHVYIHTYTYTYHRYGFGYRPDTRRLEREGNDIRSSTAKTARIR